MGRTKCVADSGFSTVACVSEDWFCPANHSLKHSLSLSHSPTDDSQNSGEKGLLHPLLPSALFHALL